MPVFCVKCLSNNIQFCALSILFAYSLVVFHNIIISVKLCACCCWNILQHNSCVCLF